MDSQVIELPPWIAMAVPALLWVSIAASLIWAALTFLQWRHRKAYNLTVAESSGGGARKPGFLSVDRQRRQAAMAGGQAFDQALAARAVAKNSPASVATGAQWARIAAVGGATLSLITGILGALMRVQWMQATMEQFGAWDRFIAIVEHNKIGFAIAALMIVAVLIDYVLTVRKS